MRVVVQIGYKKSTGRNKQGQIVKAYINDEEVSWSDEGKYITSRADSFRGELWFLANLDVSEEDSIKIEVKTSIVGVGADEDKCFVTIYMPDPNVDVKEIQFPGVGKRGFPIIKGRLVELGYVSESDKRKMDIDEFLDEGF